MLEVGDRIKKRREEDAFQALLATWRAELGVTVFENKLKDLPSWQDLVATAPPGEPVPRN